MNSSSFIHFFVCILFVNFIILPLRAENRDVVLRWQPISGTTSYLVEISLEEDFREITETFNVKDSELTYLPEKAGLYYFRVTPRFKDLILKENSTVGQINVRYEAPKIKKDDRAIRWQKVPEAEKYLVRIKQKNGTEKTIELDEPEMDKNLIEEDSEIEVVALSPQARPISSTSFSQITLPKEVMRKRKASGLPLRYIALMTGFGKNQLTSPVVSDVSKSGLIHTLEGAWSFGATHNLALRVIANNNQITRDTTLVPELSYNYELFKEKSLLQYVGIAFRRESISLIAENNYLGTDYLYYGTKFIGNLSSRLSYQFDFEHTGGVISPSRLILDYKVSRLHFYMKIFRQSVVIESPSTKQESDFTSQGLSFGIGTTF